MPALVLDQGLKETITWLHGLWGPMHSDIEDEMCQGDKVVARVTMHGRHLGEFLGHPPPAGSSRPNRSTSTGCKTGR